jgi:hypothetical protein
MNETELSLRINAASMAELDTLTSELQDFLHEHTSVSIVRTREDHQTMDGGATLVAAILATKAVTELAKGLADWMRKRNLTIDIGPSGGRIRIEGPPDRVEQALRSILASQKKK